MQKKGSDLWIQSPIQKTYLTKHQARVSNIFFLPFIVILAIFCVLVFHLPKPAKPVFVIDSLKVESSTTPVFESYIIPEPNFLLSAHSSSVEVLPNGNLIAVWFAGSHEGKPDVNIWQSLFDNQRWSMARSIISPTLVAHDTKRYVKKVGNPVIYRAQDGHLHLFVVSVGIGGWSGSSLNHFISNDEGNTWQTGQKLLLSPFINISTLNRTQAIPLIDGGFYLPVYHEFMRTYAELLRFDKNGKFLQQIHLNSHNTLLQPALLPITSSNAYVFMRNNDRIDNLLYYQETMDGGVSWTAPMPTNLTNQDSSLVVSQIKPDKYLMVHNVADRSKLALAISSDAKNWQDIYLLEDTPDKEFSYPSIQVHNGIVDILYTWERKDIKHVRFNITWLEQQVAQGILDGK